MTDNNYYGFISDVFVKDIKTGSIIRVSSDSQGAQGNAQSCCTPSISANGRYVAFESLASNLAPNDTNNAVDIFVKNLKTGSILRASTDAHGMQANGFSWGHPSISAKGRFVAFESLADNLVPGDTNMFMDIFLKDLKTGSIVRVSTDKTGMQANSHCRSPSISANGSTVAFVSNASNLVQDTGERDYYGKVFVKNLRTDKLKLISPLSRMGSLGCFFEYCARYPSISANGRSVAFSSSARFMVSNDTNEREDVFRAKIKDKAWFTNLFLLYPF